MPPIIILGNKKDLTDGNPDSRCVTPQDVNDLIAECQRIADKSATSSSLEGTANWSVLHYETSALTGEKVDTIFENMVREIRSRRRASGIPKKKKESWCFLL